jgi:hypothetical protein
MFEVGGQYENRKGKYIVLTINAPKMAVRYEDGSEAELNMAIQQRIWDNIVAEQEARQLRSRALRRSSTLDTRYYIKSLSLVEVEELGAPAWSERIGVAAEMADKVRVGDRLIYYAIENQSFFAVATITGPATVPTQRDGYFDKQREEQLHYYLVELDAFAHNMDTSLPLSSVELDSYPDVRGLLKQSDALLAITEDEFENIADILTEYTEEEEEDEEDLEEEDEYED